MFLEIRGLRSGYRQGPVLHGLDLDLDVGRPLALLGRNGAGKSTLIMTIMGLLRPTDGSVRLDGVELAGRPPYEIARAGVALVPQGRRIWPTLTVDEHIELSARRRGTRATRRRWTPRAINELLPRLAERRRHLAGQLSGGEQQMLAIARALMTEPALLLFDEPSEGLAPLVVDRIGDVIRTLAGEGVAVLLVEQDLHLAFAVSREIAVMAGGTIAHRTGTDSFRRDPATAGRLLGVDV